MLRHAHGLLRRIVIIILVITTTAKRFTRSTYWRQRVRQPIALGPLTGQVIQTRRATGRDMRRNLLVVVLEMVLGGCGGQPEPPPVGFVNQTHHSDTELWTIWKVAQVRGFPPEPPATVVLREPADIRRGDARALKVQPHRWGRQARCLLNCVDGGDRPGSGQPYRHDRLPCNVRYAAAYSESDSRDLTQYAASWEDQGDSFTFVSWTSSRTRFWPLRWATA